MSYLKGVELGACIQIGLRFIYIAIKVKFDICIQFDMVTRANLSNKGHLLTAHFSKKLWDYWMTAGQMSLKLGTTDWKIKGILTDFK